MYLAFANVISVSISRCCTVVLPAGAMVARGGGRTLARAVSLAVRLFARRHHCTVYLLFSLRQRRAYVLCLLRHGHFVCGLPPLDIYRVRCNAHTFLCRVPANEYAAAGRLLPACLLVALYGFQAGAGVPLLHDSACLSACAAHACTIIPPLPYTQPLDCASAALLRTYAMCRCLCGITTVCNFCCGH
jgi:hypothetical protein